jgi:hypothetical protein
MAEFKVGDKLKCVDSRNMEHRLKYGCFYTVLDVTTILKGTLTLVPESGLSSFEAFPERFELVKEPTANGVNAEGQPILFSEADLKPFMRVVTRGNSYIVAERDGEKFLTRNSGWDEINFDLLDQYSLINEVYPQQHYNADFLDTLVGRDEVPLWKRQAPRTAQQIALEDAIEEAEKALNVAQQKLNELKGL